VVDKAYKWKKDIYRKKTRKISLRKEGMVIIHYRKAKTEIMVKEMLHK